MNCVPCVFLKTMYNKTIKKFVFFVRLSIIVTVDFFKVHRFSFPVPVVGSSSLRRSLCRRNHKEFLAWDPRSRITACSTCEQV